MLKILDHAWHQVHSYRLHALPAEFYYLRVGHRGWDKRIRPKPARFRGFVSSDECPRPNLVLSHLDNWCDERVPLRATPYRIVNLVASKLWPDVPRVAIMHGSPDNEENRRKLVRLLDNTPGGSPFLVCNSHQAYEEWGLGPERSRAIIHGYTVDEFWSKKTRRLEIVTVCSGGNISRVYHGIPLLERIKREIPITWIGKTGDIEKLPNYTAYREYLASVLIYLHTGQGSPMPGARTEAMLSGCCVVSTDNHDARDYIQHGYTGFLSNDAGALIDTLAMLLQDPRSAYEVGRNGREAAKEFFDSQRFVADWMALMEQLGVSDG